MYVLVSYHGDTLQLPAPEYENSETNLDTVTIKRSMVGDVYTTIKSRSTETFKIKLILERVHLKQLQAFLLKYGDNALNYQDHHGQTWVGFIYNSELASTEKRTWENEVELNFEGYRLT